MGAAAEGVDASRRPASRSGSESRTGDAPGTGLPYDVAPVRADRGARRRITDHRDGASQLPQWLAIMLVALAGLLLEVGYTRIVSFKLWYYYTYLVIGLSLSGIGSGGIVVGDLAPAQARQHRADHRALLRLAAR